MLKFEYTSATTTVNIKYNQYKKNAEYRLIPFLLTKKQFKYFWQKRCHYCGDKIATIGIDRINSNKGYYFSNCTPCCTTCNKMKSSLKEDKFIEHIKKIYENSI